MATGPNPNNYASREDYERAKYEFMKRMQMESFAQAAQQYNPYNDTFTSSRPLGQATNEQKVASAPKKPAHLNPQLLLTKKG